MATFKNTTINDTSYTLVPQGTLNQRPGYILQRFEATGASTFSVPTGVTTVDVLVVGGGGGSAGIGGGGGGGGVVYYPGYPVTPGGSIPLSVGAGGAPGGTYPGPAGSSGTPSVFGALTALGGGGAGSWGSYTPNPGGSGAGGPGTPATGNSGGLAQQPAQPNPGAAVNIGYPGAQGGNNPSNNATTGSGTYTAGGGGGAGAAGGHPSKSGPGNTSAVTDAGRQGGAGAAVTITGLTQYFGGGGGGGSHYSPTGTASPYASNGFQSPVSTATGGIGGGGRGASYDFFYDHQMVDYPISGTPSSGNTNAAGTNIYYNTNSGFGAAPNPSQSSSGTVGLGAGEPGQRNTGGGSGGGYYVGGGTGDGGRGGPGVVIVRYNATGITAAAGMMRFNTDGGYQEVFDGSIWRPTKRTVVSFQATGGHTFRVPIGVTHVDVLIVAGGGSGGILGGGGGAGGHIYQQDFPVQPGSSIPITVGVGGKGIAFPPWYSIRRGQPSRFGGVEAFGGGAGATYRGNQFAYGGPPGTGAIGGGGNHTSSPSYVFGGEGYASPGGSGGGDCYNQPGGYGYGVPGQGYPGGTSPGSPPHGNAGGGGAGGAGSNGGGNPAGAGGVGLATSITGTSVYRAGGGGGGSHGPQSGNGGTGGTGGGGGGGKTSNGAEQNTNYGWYSSSGADGLAHPGQINTGGGGGGSGHVSSNPYGVGGDGGPGIVVVRY